MRSSSDSIAQLASALAKAQIELVNPAKTLTAVIHPRGPGNEERSYRYAPLSAGLEIVRKTLGKHELAVIQTTHVERESALVLLTTTVAHGSGEWVAASWPVCRTADITNPKLMGAALTYARRYSLFALVGLAGDDDLDAPELATGARDDSVPESSEAEALAAALRPPPEPQAEPIVPDPGLEALPYGVATGIPAPSPPEPDPLRKPERGIRRGKPRDRGISHEASAGAAEPRETMQELAAIEDPNALFQWALAVLPLRNRVSEDARARLDAAFFRRAEELGADHELILALAPPATTAPDRPVDAPPT